MYDVNVMGTFYQPW